jgi:conjugal transfer/entry exclusion protein
VLAARTVDSGLICAITMQLLPSGGPVRWRAVTPLRADGIQGAMNLYAFVPDAFGEAGARRAELFAASVSAALALAARQASAAELTDQMREALAR